MTPPDVGTDDHGLLELERAECLALLASVPVGRVVHTERALPAIWPVNFVLCADAVYLRTSRGSGVWQAADTSAVVAFEADAIDSLAQYGWSVVVIARAGLVTDPVALQRLREVVPAPWASGVRGEIVRIPLELVDGRRAGRAARPAPARTPPVTG